MKSACEKSGFIIRTSKYKQIDGIKRKIKWEKDKDFESKEKNLIVLKIMSFGKRQGD